jgi:Cu(I)/Ag(I) efflux system membrane fusion protein
MNKRFYLVLMLVLVVGAFVAGSWYTRRNAASTASVGGRKILYYVDPMNPSHTSDKPGLAPCGMKMEPVYADGSGEVSGGTGPSMPLGTVKITPEKQQLIGVRVGTAETKPLTHPLRLLGKVATDETRVYRINATVDGWIMKALPFATGSPVKKDETLATFYSPEFLSAGQALLFALNSKDRAQNTDMENPALSNRVTQFNINIQQYKDSLRNLGMGDRQIEEMIHNRKSTQNINIVSPADGFVVARNLSEGQRFEKGTELFRIVDLSRVWILADVFEKDAHLIQPGTEARFNLPGQNKTLAAVVSKALPQFDTTTRTLKLRLEADNPDFTLKPDMFVDVEFPTHLPEALVVPAEAVLDAGLRQTVFVDLGNGYFEPRTVQTGWRLGEQVQVLRGLTAGERIVVSGNFLLDSESRMKLAAAGVYGAPTKDPVCGMAVDQLRARAAGRTVEHHGQTFFFCCDGCKKKFETQPARYLGGSKPAPTGAAASQTARATDPVCGMTVDEAEARADQCVSEHEGKTYFFCCDACKEKFAADPERFVGRAAPAGHDRPVTAPAGPTNAASERDQPHH